MPYLADRRLCLTADKSTIVEESDARAAFLLAGEGGMVSDTDAERYGLTHLVPAPPEIQTKIHRRLGDWSHLENRR